MKSNLKKWGPLHWLPKRILITGLIFGIACLVAGLGAYLWAAFWSPAALYLEAIYISKSCMEAAPACVAAAVTAAVICDLALRDKK